MRVEIQKGVARGLVSVPPSKSCSHRAILCAALGEGESVLHGVAYSQDILATIDCVCALGARVVCKEDTLRIQGIGNQVRAGGALPVLPCRESGSTLRFLLPIAMLFGGGLLRGTERLISRGIGVYEELFGDAVEMEKKENEIAVRGFLKSGCYRLRGDVSSQFISGLLFALPLLSKDSRIEILPPFESRAYVELTIEMLGRFGVEICRESELCYLVRGGQQYRALEMTVEGDWSQAAFFYGLNFLGADVKADGIDADSRQGDRVCLEIYERMREGYAEIDLSDCPDLAPVLFATACAAHGALFTGTRRLAIKESNRARTMAEELRKFGADITVLENAVKISPAVLHKPSEVLLGHNDHRVVMALSVLATQFGAAIEGAEAIAKSYPNFFEDMRRLGLEIREYDT